MGLEKRIERTKSLFDPRHWDLFVEFTELEMASGGPDPHVAFTGALARDCSFEEKIWRGFCYISAYNVASAELIWRDWPWPRILDESMLPWFYDHWAGITTRVERKGVRIKENMEKFFDDSADWMCRFLDGKKYYLEDKGLSPTERYELLWDDVIDSVKYLGRYVAIKLLEYFRRYCGFDIELPDVRPLQGGWSPRMTLSLLYPERIEYFLAKDTPENLALIYETSHEALEVLHNSGLPEADMFTLEVALCNYRQSYVGRKLYPGRTHDTERRYMRKCLPHWKNVADRPRLQFFDVRAEIFPLEHLGELHRDWLGRFKDGVRSKDIGTMTQEGFIWSDLLYDYNATAAAGLPFNEPVVRPDGDDRLAEAFELRHWAMSFDTGPFDNEDIPEIVEPKVIDLSRLPPTRATCLEISPGELYQRGVFIDMTLRKKLALMKKYDIDMVVNFWHKFDHELAPYMWKYEHHYFPDSEKEMDEEWLLDYATYLADLIDDGHVVLVHCYGGNNRSGIMSALVMRELYGMAGKEALDHVRSFKRRAIHTQQYARYLTSLPALED